MPCQICQKCEFKTDEPASTSAETTSDINPYKDLWVWRVWLKYGAFSWMTNKKKAEQEKNIRYQLEYHGLWLKNN